MSVQSLRDSKIGRNTRQGRIWVVVLVSFFCCGLAGCGGGFSEESALEEANATNAQILANFYSQHQRENKTRGPANEAAFKAFISEINPTLLARIEVDPNSLDELFISERDGQPYKIRYGIKGTDRSDPAAVVFEQEGVDGKRIVAFTRQKVQEVEDEAEYKALLGEK